MMETSVQDSPGADRKGTQPRSGEQEDMPWNVLRAKEH